MVNYIKLMKNKTDTGDFNTNKYSFIDLGSMPTNNNNDRTLNIAYDRNRNILWRGHNRLYKSTDYTNTWTDVGITYFNSHTIRTLFFDVNTGIVYIGTGWEGFFEYDTSVNKIFDETETGGDHNLFAGIFFIKSYNNTIFYGTNNTRTNWDSFQPSIYYKSGTNWVRVKLSGENTNDRQRGEVLSSIEYNNKLIIGKNGYSTSGFGGTQDSYIHILDNTWNEIDSVYMQDFVIRGGIISYKSYIYVTGVNKNNNNVAVYRMNGADLSSLEKIYDDNSYDQVRNIFIYDSYLWITFYDSGTDKSYVIGGLNKDLSNIDSNHIIGEATRIIDYNNDREIINDEVYFGTSNNSSKMFKLTKY